MAIAFVNGTTRQANSTTSTSLTYTASAGNIVVVHVGFSPTVTSLTVKDANNVVLTAGPSVSNSPLFGQLFYYTVPGGGSGASFSVSWTGTSSVGIFLGEYSGAAGGVNSTGGTNSGTTSPQSISLTSTGANSFIVGVLQTLNATVSMTAGNQREAISAGNFRGALADNTAVSSGSSLTLSSTSSNQTWIATSVELLLTAAAAGPFANSLMMMGGGK